MVSYFTYTYNEYDKEKKSHYDSQDKLLSYFTYDLDAAGRRTRKNEYDPEGKLNSAVTINFGYRPLFVIPAQAQDIDYSMSWDNGELHINNTGNSFVRAHIDQCTDEVTEDCEVTIMSLAGRERSYPLPKNIDPSNLKVTVVNHDESYRQDVTLSESK